MSYTLQHTAEAIDYKLDLIDKTKNLLPYPYTGTFQNGFEDIGDGSILVNVDPSWTSEIILIDEANFTLPANTSTEDGTTCVYKISLTATDITEASTELINRFSLKVTKTDGTVYKHNDINKGVFILNSESPVKVSLLVEAGVKASNLLLKPQIEEIVVKEDEVPTATSWVPYMKTMCSYIDERFTSNNAKLNVLNNYLIEQDIAILAEAQKYTDDKTNYTVSTEDLTDGVSSLPDGAFYYVITE